MEDNNGKWIEHNGTMYLSRENASVEFTARGQEAQARNEAEEADFAKLVAYREGEEVAKLDAAVESSRIAAADAIELKEIMGLK